MFGIGGMMGLGNIIQMVENLFNQSNNNNNQSDNKCNDQDGGKRAHHRDRHGDHDKGKLGNDFQQYIKDAQEAQQAKQKLLQDLVHSS